MSTPTDDLTGALQRAHALCELARFAEASQLLHQTISSHPQNPDAWSLLAAAELSAGNPDACLQAAERAISLAPESEWPHRLASAALRRLGRIGESIDHARGAVRIDPDNWPALIELARSLAHNDPDLEEARSAAARALELAPNNPDTHLAAGVVAAAAKNRAEAEASFRKALSIDPNNTAAHNELARMQMKRQTRINPTGLANAATGFANSIRIDPHTERARHNLELVLRMFLAKTSYLILLDAYIVARVTSSSSNTIARLLPVALLAVPAGYAWRFVAGLDTNLREHLLRLLTHDRNIRLAAGLDAAAIACLLASALAPESARAGLAGAAALSTLVARLILYSQIKHTSRAAHELQAKPTLSSTALGLIAISLILAAILMVYATTSAHARAGGIVFAVLCTAGSAAILHRIRQRQASNSHTAHEPS
jgi:Flp pilus assembly protein TadD